MFSSRFLLLFLIFAFACSPAKQVFDGANKSERPRTFKTTEAIAQKRFGEKYTIADNSSGSHCIIYKKEKKLEDLIANLSFVIVEKETGTILHENSLTAGTVRWHSDYEVMAISRNKNTEPSKVVYLFDVKTGKIKNL